MNCHRLCFAALAAIIVVGSALAQNIKCVPSKETSISAVGANETVVYSDVHRVVRIFGQITDTSEKGLDSIIEVYPVGSFGSSRVPASSMIVDKRPFRNYMTDGNGRFCLADLRQGKYLLKIGTDRFAYKFLVVSVWLKKGGSRKVLKFHLNVGT